MRGQTHTTNKQAAIMVSLSTATKGLENIRAARKIISHNGLENNNQHAHVYMHKTLLNPY